EYSVRLSSAVWAMSGVWWFDSTVPLFWRKARSVGICSTSDGTSGLSRVKWTLSNVMGTTGSMPLPSGKVDKGVVVVVGAVVGVVDVELDVDEVVGSSLVDVDVDELVVEVDVELDVDVVGSSVVDVVVVLLLVDVVEVVVVGGERALTTDAMHASTIGSKSAA